MLYVFSILASQKKEKCPYLGKRAFYPRHLGVRFDLEEIKKKISPLIASILFSLLGGDHDHIDGKLYIQRA